MTDPSAPSPPKGLTSSPSIFAYQTRILQRTTSTRQTTTPNSQSSSSGLTSLSAIANSPPSTPIRQNVAKMSNNFPEIGRSSSGLGMGMGGRSAAAHGRNGKSVDLVRGQWEAKINEAGAMDTTATPKSLKRSSMFSPPLASSSTFSTVPSSPPIQTPSTSGIIPTGTGDSSTGSSSERFSEPSSSGYRSGYVSSRMTKHTPASSMEGLDSIHVPETPTREGGSTIRPRPPSVSSYTSILSPTSTGSSSIASNRSQQVEDTLAQARANALKRLEARKKAKAEAAGEVYVPPSPASDISTLTRTLEVTTITAKLDKLPQHVTSPDVGGPSPFANLFSPPNPAIDATPTRSTTVSDESTPTSRSTRASYRSIVTPPSAPSISSRYIPSGLSANNTPESSSSGSSTATGGKDKYGSISRTDKRRLGRHLPRIASGEGGWEEEEGHARIPSGRERIPSTLGKNAISATEDAIPPATPARKVAEVLTPSNSDNRLPPITPSTPNVMKRRSGYLPQTPKGSLSAATGLLSPRAEVAGEEMKGLMSAVGALPSRGATNDDGEGVTGMSNRLRLSRSTLPPSASSATVAPAPLPSRRLMQSNWMDKQRHAIAAYEYLCHVGEAQQWVEGCLDEELGFGVTEMEEGLRDGVVLAKLARKFLGEGVVKKIWTDTKHRYKQTDNIDAFMKFLRTVGMPSTFTFDPIDLYESKNIPKVIFSLHVLSHLLARQGLAERIGNLVGQFEFTDEQLAKTQKGLQGVAMPNFGDARKTLAKEASWVEPEEPEETEDERRDRELLECEPSIIGLQKHLRGRLARMRISRINAQLELAESIIIRLQAKARGGLDRRVLMAKRDEQMALHGWAVSLQSAARASMSSKRWNKQITAVRSSEGSIISVQAQARGMIARMKVSAAQNNLDKSRRGIIGLQAVCRGCLARRQRIDYRQALVQPQVAESITTMQALIRGRLLRQAAVKQQQVIAGQAATFIFLQSYLRGALVRRNHRAHEEKLEDATDYIVAIQATARGVLSRRKKQTFVKNVQQTFTGISSLQAIARGRLAKQSHQSMQKALAKVEVAGSVGGLQAFLRTKLAKRQTTEQKKKLEFVQPDVIGFQAVARGYLARKEYRDWRDYLQDPHTQGALVFLQSLVRGFLARRRLWIRTSYIHRNVDKVVKIQSIWRGRVQRQMYDRLLTGEDVDVLTIQNYMHLLDDTDADYQRQIHTENLRKEVVELIRENQTLETEVTELDTKIALILKNKMTFEELARVKHARSNYGQGAEIVFTHGGNRDPFTSGAHLDRASQRKLELFEHLFFTLQTKGEYLSRLLFALSRDEGDDRDRRLVDGVTLILFGFGHERREDYLFHKMLQLAVHEEILRSKALNNLAEARFAIIAVATQYIKPHMTPYLQEVLTGHVMRVVEAAELDLTTDPGEIYRRLINEEESSTGLPSSKPRDLDGNQVLQTDEHARGLYIQHLQELRHLTKDLLDTLFRSTSQLPYTVRLLSREALLALRVKYPEATDTELTPIVARTVILPFVLPAIIAPESYGIAASAVGPVQRKNLAAIANLIVHVAAQDFTSVNDWFVRTPLQEYIRSDGVPFRDWIMDVAAVDPLESFFQAHELFESTTEAKPIMITRTEIYGMLSILIKHTSTLTAGKPKDPIALVLQELEGPPIDYDKTKTTISLRLTNRLAELQPTGPDAQQKEDWVQAKRHVLAVLRVQTGRTLYDVLVSRPTEEDEGLWAEMVWRDMEREKRTKGDLPPTPVEAEYRIQSIRSLPFHEVKSRAIEFCIKLEKSGKLSRSDAFQGLLVSIASDIRQKHHLRKMQRQNAVAMEQAHGDMKRKHDKFEEQIKSYHLFIDSSMASLQKGKKKPTFLSKQYFHQRSEAKSGKKAKFGSYKYTAADIYARGILLGINQLSPNVFNDVYVIIASNEVGVFTLELSSATVPIPNASPGAQAAAVMGREQVRMEDLLQAQFENELNLLLFDGMATFSINMLIHQINKKFYSS